MGMKNEAKHREEALNTILADVLTQEHQLRCIPEQRIHGERKTPDLTVSASLECPHTLMGEAKMGTEPAKQKQAEKQAKRWTRGRNKQGLALAVCYPKSLERGGTPEELREAMRKTDAIEWAIVKDGEGLATWRKGGVRQLAESIRNASEHRGDIERLLSGAIVETTKLWVHDRERATEGLAQALSMQTTGRTGEKVLRIGTLMLMNGCLLDQRLQDTEAERTTTIKLIGDGETLKTGYSRRWKSILEVDYAPIFEPALTCLKSLPQGEETEWVLDTLRSVASSCANALGTLNYDVAGPIYHRLLDTAQYDGSFYTTPASAMLLARLVTARTDCDWSNADAIGKLRIIDPACGTGTLLLAVQHAVRDLHAGSGGSPDSTNIVHLDMVQQVLHGLDINHHAIQLAACNLTMSSPNVDYHRIPLYTMRHGVHGKGRHRRAWAGSAELLVQEQDKGQMVLALGGERTEQQIEMKGHRNKRERFETELGNPSSFDIVIMNPPFTRNDIRNRQLDAEARRQLQKREIAIAKILKSHDVEGASAIDQSSIRTFFTPLADTLLKKEGRVLGEILPTTAMTSPAGEKERKFIARRWDIATVITSHDPRRVYFSGETDIHESMLVAEKPTDGNAPTRFIQLHRNPDSKDEVLALEEAARTGNGLRQWGRKTEWPKAKMRRGDWSAAMFYDEKILDALEEIKAFVGTRLAPLGELAHVGPEGRRCREAFENRNIPGGKYALLWQHVTDRQKTMSSTHDRRANAKDNKQDYVTNRLWPQAGRLFIGNKLRLNLTRTPSVWLSEPALGSAWCPVRARNRAGAETTEKAWCVWLNSTPGIALLLMQRTKHLTYPAFPLANLRALPVPNPEEVSVNGLKKAFESHSQQELKSLPDMARDNVRAQLDAAATRVLGISGDIVGEWRKTISAEPTLTERPVEQEGE